MALLIEIHEYKKFEKIKEGGLSVLILGFITIGKTRHSMIKLFKKLKQII